MHHENWLMETVGNRVSTLVLLSLSVFSNGSGPASVVSVLKEISKSVEKVGLHLLYYG
jgi:hypothetical protein